MIRYASLDELQGKPTKRLLLRPRVWVYATILLAALVGILYGLTSLAPIELKVLHERALATRPSLRVAYMSGYTDGTVATQGLLQEGACFVAKPFGARDLVQKVREALDS